MKRDKCKTHTILHFRVNGGKDGSLIALEQRSSEIPFTIKRVYYIYSVAIGLRRGFHAHKKLKQVLIGMSGSCDVMLDDGKTREIVTLNRPDFGVYLDRPVWREMYNFSKDCVLLVLANDYYLPNDYIRDYKLFLKMGKDGKI